MVVSTINTDPAHHFEGDILGVGTAWQCSCYVYIDCGGNAKPRTPRGIGNSNIGRAHACRECSQCTIGASVTVGSNDDVTGDDVSTLWHYLVTDAFLQNGYVVPRSEEHTSELQSLAYLVCRL